MDELRLRRDGPIATLVLNRPEKRNAITVEMWRAIPRVLQELDAERGIRAVVVRGAGEEAFASGADISEFEAVRANTAAARAYSRTVAAAEHALGTFPARRSHREGVRAFLEKRPPRFGGG